MKNITSLLPLFLLAACGQESERNAETSTENPPPAVTEESAETIAHYPNKEAWFGNLHIHTSWSFDGFTNGSVTEPDDAYRWAQGESIPGGGDGTPLQILRPLDWYAVSEHAEYMGVFKNMDNPDSPFSKLEIAKEITSDDQAVATAAFARILDDMNKGIPQPELNDPELAKSLWVAIQEIADRHYKPGKFTTFPAFEWTSAPNNLNLHRVVLFKHRTGIPELAYSTIDSNKPEDLWKYMEAARENGAELLAVPHNGNSSNGLMFNPTVDSYGEPISKAYSESRMRNEPVYEITQIKGTSEAHPNLSPNDEFASFELWEYTLSAITERATIEKGGYVREALKDGLRLEQQGAGNPYKYGFIGDSDTHNSAAAVEENNYTGKFGFENDPDHRINGLPGAPEPMNQQVREFGSGGLAGVWAVENTRDAIFEAIESKETFATTGTRMKLRFFAGDYADGLLERKGWLATAYADGVPMGGELQSGPESPVFLIHAIKDANGANLDRVQVVKGWVDAEGNTHEAIFDVALSDGRNDGYQPVGNTVDASNATYTNTIGDVEFLVSWTDPEYQAGQAAFYYLRVLEIPTPRWSTYDAAKLGQEIPEGSPASIQERGYSSPIWLNP